MMIKISQYDAEVLNDYTLDTYEFGKKGGNDKDLLHIIKPNVAMDGALHNRDHFLFYKDIINNVDHLYATPRLIVNGLLTGSSDLPYHLLASGVFNSGYMSWLGNKNDEVFHTQKTVKCLLGVAKRDLRQAPNHKDTEKKMYWVEKYIGYTENILERQGIDFRKEPSGSRYCDMEYIEYLRFMSKELPKCTPKWAIPLLFDMSYKDTTNEYEYLSFVNKLLYVNWGESL